MLEAEGWGGVECYQYLDKTNELKFHGCEW
jgi:hypothetical protein